MTADQKRAIAIELDRAQAAAQECREAIRRAREIAISRANGQWGVTLIAALNELHERSTQIYQQARGLSALITDTPEAKEAEV
jgi:hypothetical protein